MEFINQLVRKYGYNYEMMVGIYDKAQYVKTCTRGKKADLVLRCTELKVPVCKTATIDSLKDNIIKAILKVETVIARTFDDILLAEIATLNLCTHDKLRELYSEYQRAGQTTSALNNYKLEDLRRICRQYKQPIIGPKKALIQTLMKYYRRNPTEQCTVKPATCKKVQKAKRVLRMPTIKKETYTPNAQGLISIGAMQYIVSSTCLRLQAPHVQSRWNALNNTVETLSVADLELLHEHRIRYKVPETIITI